VDNPNLSEITKSMLRSYGDLPFKGYYDYYHDNLKGSMIWDMRLGYEFTKFSISLIVKNLFNNSYTLRPMFVEPPRSYTLQFIYQIN